MSRYKNFYHVKARQFGHLAFLVSVQDKPSAQTDAAKRNEIAPLAMGI
jgi:hypothetical protein